MADVNSLLKEIDQIFAGKSAVEKDTVGKQAQLTAKNLAAALKKLRKQSLLTQKKLKDEAAASKTALDGKIASAKAVAAAEKGDAEAKGTLSASRTALKNLYRGVTGDEAAQDAADYLEAAETEKGRADKKAAETVYSLEQKAVAEDKARAEAEENELYEKAAEEEKLVADARARLESIIGTVKAKAADEAAKLTDDGSNGLTAAELKSLCNTMIKRATYRGTFYITLLKREYALLESSGQFIAGDLDKIRKRLYMEDKII